MEGLDLGLLKVIVLSLNFLLAKGLISNDWGRKCLVRLMMELYRKQDDNIYIMTPRLFYDFYFAYCTIVICRR